MKRARKILISATSVFISALLIFAGIKIFYSALYPTKYKELVEKYSEQNGLEPSLVFAVIRCESGFRQDAKSHKDAHGLMQITPDTLEWLVMVEGGGEVPDIYDPEQNIKYGTELLRLHSEEFGSLREMLSAYHAGRGAVNEWLGNSEYSSDGKTLDVIPYDDTNDYVNKVIEVKRVYDMLLGKKNK